MVQYIEKYKQNIAIDMRKRGMSYSDIQNKLNVPKSTLSFWLKNLKLTEDQKKRLNQNRLEALKRGSKNIILKTKKNIEEIKNSSAQDIKEISKKELWLMGIILYWRERFLNGNESDLRKGIKFTSSDPYLVKLFLKWLQDIGKIKNEELRFDIFIGKDRDKLKDDIVKFWSEVTEFSRDNFTRFYFYETGKRKLKLGKRAGNNAKRNLNRTKYGLLRIRVKSSSMLARQIYGWIRGIIKYYWE